MTVVEERVERSWWVTAALGAGVIAACYGFGRYAYGLFVPTFAEVFGLGATGIGILGGLATLGYTAGLVLAPRLSRGSARTATVISGGIAAAGLVTMGLAQPVGVFAGGLILAGASAGLVSPAVAQVIGQTVRHQVRPQAQTWANSGTSLGLALSAFTPVLVFGWRAIWLGFGLLAAGVTLAALAALPRAGRGTDPPAVPPPGSSRWTPGLAPLLLSAVLLGLTSAPYWNFSIDRIQSAGLDPHLSAWFWLVMGLAGPLGGLAGAGSSRYGLSRTNLGTWSLWSVALLILALPVLGTVAALASAAVFGATYMALTGLLIVWGARLFPDRPARGVTLSFLCLGVGQTLGAPLAGVLADHRGLPAVFLVAAGMSLLAWLPALRPAPVTAPLAPAR